ncbi:hypothetical protein MTO96_044680 [Rhipicephalus appendiculatus]
MCPVRFFEVSFLILGSDAKACFHNVSLKFSAVSVKKLNISLEALGILITGASPPDVQPQYPYLSPALPVVKLLHRRLKVFSVGAILPSIEDSTDMVKS